MIDPNDILIQLFGAEEIAKITSLEGPENEESLKIYRDWYSITQTAIRKAKEEGIQQGREEGIQKAREERIQQNIEKGREEGIKQMAKALIAEGMPIENISKITNLPVSVIKSL